MESLINKTKRSYDYTSRYATFLYYYNKNDKKYMYGITSSLNSDTEYTLHQIVQTDTLDSLALKYYGRPDLFWVIADFNRINDAYINLYEEYNFIFIPSLTSIRFK